MFLNCRLFLFTALAFVADISNAEWFVRSTTAMTTRVELEFWRDDSSGVERISQQVFREFDRIEKMMTRYREDSELSRVNQSAAKQPVSVSRELYFVFHQAQRVSELSLGAFDITFASAGYLYDFRKALQPSPSELSPQLANISYRYIILDETLKTVRFQHSGVKVDLGGIAKGYAVDQGISILKKTGIEHARLSAGGDMRLLGDKRGKPWIVGIKDPRANDRHAVALPLADVAISTSGDYERFFVDEAGERIHHILSPKTGRPVKGIQSTTVIGVDATTTDALSTAIFVLGVEQGLAMVNRLSGIDAIIIDSQRKLHFSDGLEDPGHSQR